MPRQDADDKIAPGGKYDPRIMADAPLQAGFMGNYGAGR